MKGIIALDLDGTITADGKFIPEDVQDHLKFLNDDGWKITFATGRSFPFAYSLIKIIDFPFYLASQNGSIAFKIPEMEVISKRYIPREDLLLATSLLEDLNTDVLASAGIGPKEESYYRPSRLNKETVWYFESFRNSMGSENIVPVDSFESLPHKEFSNFKWFGSKDCIEEIVRRLDEKLELNIPIIKDPYNDKYYIAVANLKSTSKAEAIKDIINFEEKFSGPIIAAGDDYNDKEMLDFATVSIAMSTGPEEIVRSADICAKPASESGIIDALSFAIKLAEERAGMLV